MSIDCNVEFRDRGVGEVMSHFEAVEAVERSFRDAYCIVGNLNHCAKKIESDDADILEHEGEEKAMDRCLDRPVDEPTLELIRSKF